MLISKWRKDPRTYLDNLSNSQLKYPGGFKGIRTHDLCDASAMLYQVSYEATIWEQVNLCLFPFTMSTLWTNQATLFYSTWGNIVRPKLTNFYSLQLNITTQQEDRRQTRKSPRKNSCSDAWLDLFCNTKACINRTLTYVTALPMMKISSPHNLMFP